VVAAGIAAAAALLVAPRSDPPPAPVIVDGLEIAPRVTVVATDGCMPPTGEFPSLNAPGDVAAPRGDVQVTPSGVRVRVLAEGCAGRNHPGPSDVVTVRMAGWTMDGIEIVHMRGLTNLPLTAVVPGFRDGVQLMHRGDRVRMWVPSGLAYGTTRTAGRPGGDLTFDVELVDIKPSR